MITTKDIVQVAAFNLMYKILPPRLSLESRFVQSILLTSDEAFMTIVRDNQAALEKYLKKVGLFDTNLKISLDKRA